MLKYGTKVIASKMVLCDNFLMKGTGLMFRSRNSVKDKAWIFLFDTPKSVSITMIFVFFPIDVVFLDAKNRIVEMRENLEPFTINYTSRLKISKFIELKQGTITKYSLCVGKKLELGR